MADAFGARSTLDVGGERYEIFRLERLQASYDIERLPYTLKILLENVIRTATPESVEAVAQWAAKEEPSREIAFTPARVIHQDFTGVPAIVDLAAMRHAMHELTGDASKTNPQLPSELVIDHSVQVDAFANLKVVPPETGIVHQVNLEYLGRVVEARNGQAFPDTLLGTDSHTTMINGLGVLGWGVGGIEAEAAMLGESVSMLVPQVVGFRLTGALREGATATDLVLTVTQILRQTGVVGKLVEYFGAGVSNLPLADRATIGNMSPEYGATCGFFPVDDVTLEYLRLTGRPKERIALVEAYCKENLLWHDAEAEPTYSQVVELDLGDVEPSLAGPRRPQDRVPLALAKQSFLAQLESFGVDYTNGTHDQAVADTFPASDPTTEQAPGGEELPDTPVPVAVAEPARHRVPVRDTDYEVEHGSVVIAAITSCTNTSNPQVMVAAGLLAKKAVELGLERKPWVKSSLAPGSKVVTRYYEQAGLQRYLDELGFNTIGYGCTTCIGNSGPLAEEISEAIAEGHLVVAYSLAGRMDIEWDDEPVGVDRNGDDVFLRDLWPSAQEVGDTIASSVRAEHFSETYSDVFTGDEEWRSLPVPESELYEWDPGSTYVRLPPYFDGMPREQGVVGDVEGGRCLVILGDSVTTDHISPAGAIRPDSPAGGYLIEHGVERKDFNSYGARR